MQPSISPYAILFYFYSTISTVQTDWKLSFHHTCDNKSDPHVVYWITAVNRTHAIHFLFGADPVVKPPTLIMLFSPLSTSQISVNCEKYKNATTFRNSITASAIEASYGIIFYQLCQYIDDTDTARISSNPTCSHYFLHSMKWKLELTDIASDNRRISVSFIGKQWNDSYDEFLPNGHLRLKFTVYAEDTSSSDHYYHVTAGVGVEMSLVIDRVKVAYRSTRIAPLIVVFSNQSLEDTDDFSRMDDYLSNESDGPLGKLKTPCIQLDERSRQSTDDPSIPPAFIQFPPVYDRVPIGNHQSHLGRISLGPFSPIHTHKHAHRITDSIAFAYYGDRFNQIHALTAEGHVGARFQYVNLGSSGDGFYVATNYTSWSLLLKIGHPKVEGKSVARVWTAITLSSVFGTVIGISYYIYHRRRRLQSQIHRYEPVLQSLEYTVQNVEDAPVEPFLMRKALVVPPSSGRKSTNDSYRQPILRSDHRPPSYETMLAEEM